HGRRRHHDRACPVNFMVAHRWLAQSGLSPHWGRDRSGIRSRAKVRSKRRGLETMGSRFIQLLAIFLLLGAGPLLSDALAAQSQEPLELEYWHFYSGPIGEMHNQLVEEFN